MTTLETLELSVRTDDTKYCTDTLDPRARRWILVTLRVKVMEQVRTESKEGHYLGSNIVLNHPLG